MYILNKDRTNLVEAANVYVKEETEKRREEGFFSVGYVDVTWYRIYAEGRKRPEDEKMEVFLMGSYKSKQEAAKEMERIADALSSGAPVYKIS